MTREKRLFTLSALGITAITRGDCGHQGYANEHVYGSPGPKKGLSGCTEILREPRLTTHTVRGEAFLLLLHHKWVIHAEHLISMGTIDFCICIRAKWEEGEKDKEPFSPLQHRH